MNTLFFHGSRELEVFQIERKNPLDSRQPGLYLIQLRQHLMGGRRTFENLLDSVGNIIPEEARTREI